MHLLSLYWCFKIKVKQKVYFLNDQLFTKNWIGFMYQYDQRVIFKLQSQLVQCYTKNKISYQFKSYYLLGFRHRQDCKCTLFLMRHLIFSSKNSNFIIQNRYSFINTRQLHVFFNKPELEDPLFVGFTCAVLPVLNLKLFLL